MLKVRSARLIPAARLLLAIPLLTAAAGLAQSAGGGRNFDGPPERSPARITGSVSGTVFFADTQRPARFANVQLISATTDGESRFRGGGGPSGRTALDGTFAIEGVEVGDYYVSASATGYISPFAEAQAAIAGGAKQDEALRHLPVVHVSQGASANASVTLERGGVIAGTVVWDDGSPAAGVQVSTVSAIAQTNTIRGGFGGGAGAAFGRFPGGAGDITDDRGHFRLMGVAPGEYYVRASVQAPTGAGNSGRGGFARTISLTAYAPNRMRRTDGQIVKLDGAEERDDVAITLDLRALHAVSGRVSAAGGSAISGGQVRLVDSTDSSLSRFGEIGSDGSFNVPYVPAGTYTMLVNARSGGSGTPGPGGGGFTPGQSLQPLQQTLAVADSDVSGLSVTVTPAVTAASR